MRSEVPTFICFKTGKKKAIWILAMKITAEPLSVDWFWKYMIGRRHQRKIGWIRCFCDGFLGGFRMVRESIVDQYCSQNRKIHWGWLGRARSVLRGRGGLSSHRGYVSVTLTWFVKSNWGFAIFRWFPAWFSITWWIKIGSIRVGSFRWEGGFWTGELSLTPP